MDVLLVRCATGSPKDAALALGISVHTVRQHLKLLRIGYGFSSDATACYALASELRALADSRGTGAVPPSPAPVP